MHICYVSIVDLLLSATCLRCRLNHKLRVLDFDTSGNCRNFLVCVDFKSATHAHVLCLVLFVLHHSQVSVFGFRLVLVLVDSLAVLISA